jgi:choline dehydrogenase-like flavoprotein
MAIIDLTSPSAVTPLPRLAYDVCVVGSGPAGATIAKELSGSGLTVALLESGGMERDPRADALNWIENIGRPRARDQWSVRNRIVGGSSHTWGGRCAGFDEIDFQRRDWVQNSGWPLSAEDVEPYLERSAPHLGLVMGGGFSDERFWDLASQKHPKREVDPSLLLPFFWQFSRDTKESYPFEYMRFGRHLKSELDENITLLTGATVTRVLCTPGQEYVQGVEFATFDGARHTLRANAVVLGAGGVENARLLLNSGDAGRNGLGNDHDQVGRYLMDHLRGPVAHFDVEGTSALQRRFGRYNLEGRFFRAGLRLSPEVQKREHLLNSAVWLGEVLSSQDPWDALRRVAARKARLREDVTLLARNSVFMLRAAIGYFASGHGLPRKVDELTLECMCEQVPDADSRITLSDKTDSLGMRLPRVDWRSHPDETRTMHRTAELSVAEFTRIGHPVPKLEQWVMDKAPIPSTFVDVAHPTGTTRMAASPASGVVDVNCEVFGTAGLFISGSSVFPTAGHCNPTQMIVAMAVRLADHLKKQAYESDNERVFANAG